MTNEQEIAVNTLILDLETPRINVELLERVAAYIEQHPEEFDMEDWGTDRRSFVDKVLRRPQVTAGCVACHTVRLGGGNKAASTPAEAQRLLGISDDQAERLFYADEWPDEYRKKFENAASTDSLAWIAARRFRRFVATNGAE